jgi:hypothetical protein
MVKRILDRLRKRHQGIGYAKLVLYGFFWLIRTLSAGKVDIHYRYILMQSVPEEPLLKGRSPGPVEIHRLDGAEVLSRFDSDRDGAFSRAPRDRGRIERRIARGDVCIAATRASRTVGVLWLTFTTFDETEVKALFVVGPGTGMAWDSNLFIVEDARAGLIFVALWDSANEFLREKAYRWCATQTAAFNGPSLQAHGRLGARRIGRIVYVLLGPMQVTFSSLRPHFHVSGASGRAPVFVIPPPAAAKE